MSFYVVLSITSNQDRVKHGGGVHTIHEEWKSAPAQPFLLCQQNVVPLARLVRTLVRVLRC